MATNQDKLDILKQKVENHPRINYAGSGDLEDVEKFNELYVDYEVRGYIIKDFLEDLAEHGIRVSSFFPDVDKSMFFTPIEEEQSVAQQITDAIHEWAETYSTGKKFLEKEVDYIELSHDKKAELAKNEEVLSDILPDTDVQVTRQAHTNTPKADLKRDKNHVLVDIDSHNHHRRKIIDLETKEEVR